MLLKLYIFFLPHPLGRPSPVSQVAALLLLLVSAFENPLSFLILSSVLIQYLVIDFLYTLLPPFPRFSLSSPSLWYLAESQLWRPNFMHSFIKVQPSQLHLFLSMNNGIRSISFLILSFLVLSHLIHPKNCPYGLHL